MKKTLLFSAAIALIALETIGAEDSGYSTTTNGTWVWTDVTITKDNQDNYLSGGGAFSDATAATLNIGVSQGEGSLTIDGGSLVTPNCLFIGGKGWLNPDTSGATNNGSVTVTNGGELTIAGKYWDGASNATVKGAQLSLANSSGGVSATLNVTNGGKVHANAGTVVAGGDCTAEINISGQGSVMDFALRGETQASYLTAYIGLDGTAQGTVNVSDGGKLSTTGSTLPLYMYLGTNGTSNGTLNVDGGTVEMGNSVAILGYGGGTNGAVNVKNGGSVVIGTAYVGNSGHGEFTVDETSTAVFGNMTVADGSLFTNQGTAVFYGKLSMSGKAVLDGSGTVNLLEGAALTNSNCNLDINTLLVEGSSTANLSSDAAGTLKIANIFTLFDSADGHNAAGTAAVLMSGTNAASDLSGAKWFFEIDSTTAAAINGGTSTKYLTNQTGIKANAYFCDGNWYEAVSTDGTGTYIAKKVVATITDANLSNSNGSVSAGQPINNENNHAEIVADTETADLYVRVETSAKTTGDVNGTLQVTTDDKTYAVNNAYVSSALTLDKTDLVAAGSVTVQGNVNLTQSNITSTTQGTVLNSTIKGTGTLTNLAINNSTLIAGNSPGLMTLTQSDINSGALKFYVGSEAKTKLESTDSVALSLSDEPLVTSGFVVNSDTVLSGDITLDLWTEELTFAFSYLEIFNIGDSLQLFKAGDGADLSLALAGANLTLGTTFGTAVASGGKWDTSNLKTNGTVSVVAVPEPSVFGLLAGIGALALAGTRRRRRR